MHQNNSLCKSISSEEALLVVEILLSEIPLFIEKYELGDEFSWKEWYKKHGVYAALGVIALGLRIYSHWKRKRERIEQYGYSQFSHGHDWHDGCDDQFVYNRK